MLVVITGGAASGKSALGETVCVRLGGALLYIATMPPHDAECAARIQKHRDARAGKGFDTVEWYANLDKQTLPKPYNTAILECMSNLVANELFAEHTPPAQLVEKLLSGVAHIQGRVENLVVITNEVFGGAERYEGDMAEYLWCLGSINCALMQKADCVIESVCGLPVVHKGKGVIA